MVDGGRDLPGPGVGVAGPAQLPQRGAEVEVRSLADHPLAVELENDDEREVDLAARRRQPAPIAEMGAAEAPLDDDRVVGVVHRLRLEAKVGKSLLVLLEKGVDAPVAVPYFARGDDLIARMREGRDASIELVRVLGLHVLPDRGLPNLACLELDAH